MEKIFLTICISFCVLILVSCSSPVSGEIINQLQSESPTTNVPSRPPTSLESVTQHIENQSNLNEKTTPLDLENTDLLEGFNKEEIEYASIWFQLGPNQEIDELNVNYIKAGTPLNEEDITSAVYEEDVTMLSGSRLVDGVVTYSKNEDGTINVYPIPLRWDGVYPASYEFYLELLAKKKIVTLEKVEVVDLIKLLPLIIMRENN